MAPVAGRVNEAAISPYNDGELSFEEAERPRGQSRASSSRTREAELQLVELSNYQAMDEGAEELPMASSTRPCLMS